MPQAMLRCIALVELKCSCFAWQTRFFRKRSYKLKRNHKERGLIRFRFFFFPIFRPCLFSLCFFFFWCRTIPSFFIAFGARFSWEPSGPKPHKKNLWFLIKIFGVPCVRGQSPATLRFSLAWHGELFSTGRSVLLSQIGGLNCLSFFWVCEAWASLRVIFCISRREYWPRVVFPQCPKGITKKSGRAFR